LFIVYKYLNFNLRRWIILSDTNEADDGGVYVISHTFNKKGGRVKTLPPLG